MRQIAILGGLLAVSLVGSYLTWTSDDVRPEGADTVAMYVGTADDISAIRWSEEFLDVELTRAEDEHGAYTRIVVTERAEVMPDPEPKPVDAEGEDASEDPSSEEGEDPSSDDSEAGDDAPDPVVEPEIETTVTTFVGNTRADELWDSFGPLYALRKLEGADANSVAFGLDSADTTLEIVRRSGPIEIAVGGQSYGTKDRYVRFEGQVYLLDDRDLVPLTRAKTQLVERRLTPLATHEALRLEVAKDGKSVSFTQRNIDDLAAASWSRDGAGGDADDTAGSWIDNLLRLQTGAYLAEDELPALEPVMSYTVHGKLKSWPVEVFLGAANKAGIPDYYARTPYNRGTVLLTRAQAMVVIEDADTVLAGGAPSEHDHDEE